MYNVNYAYMLPYCTLRRLAPRCWNICLVANDWINLNFTTEQDYLKLRNSYVVNMWIQLKQILKYSSSLELRGKTATILFCRDLLAFCDVLPPLYNKKIKVALTWCILLHNFELLKKFSAMIYWVAQSHAVYVCHWHTCKC